MAYPERNRPHFSGWTPINAADTSQAPTPSQHTNYPTTTSTTPQPPPPGHTENAAVPVLTEAALQRNFLRDLAPQSTKNNKPFFGIDSYPTTTIPISIPTRPKLMPVSRKHRHRERHREQQQQRAHRTARTTNAHAASLLSNANIRYPSTRRTQPPLVKQAPSELFDPTACPPDKLFTVDTAGCAAFRGLALMAPGPVTVEGILSRAEEKKVKAALEEEEMEGGERSAVVGGGGRARAIDDPALDADYTPPFSSAWSECEEEDDDEWDPEEYRPEDLV
ncbi:uncharacterized protein K452DRAFT_341474 [Aplosporella prunicola CBS 121167]|uniref:Uncharacterized protein n=1 Tax=Aplosporella prunicola CBS 121167 TaxID=1176127 RepID=A0A6A6AZA3_9PEZI|nr:uncharacterized protein K452DRAFT_341474 [Aplosporella prunicola CBS 121167]KAF2137249.1 hypothetical protein K452DRAFT_341474 [Aplosporella prunicola CBS 121167]